MKEFDLKAALNGEPVMLKNGQKAVIKFNILDDVENLAPSDSDYPLFGYRLNEGHVYTLSWDLSGKSIHWAVSEYNIVGMWEEPKISIEDLPKPFKPKDCEPFYYIYRGKTYCDHEYSERSPTYRSFSQNGQCFRSEKDAQKWLDFMKSMME